jgi:hypothetical protein
MARIGELNPQGAAVYICAVLPKALSRMPGPFFIFNQVIRLSCLINKIMSADL